MNGVAVLKRKITVSSVDAALNTGSRASLTPRKTFEIPHQRERDRIVEFDILGDPERLAKLDLVRLIG